MEIHEDPWLAAIFGRPVFRVALSADDAPDPQDLSRHAAGRLPSAFYYAKVDTARIDHVRALAAAGFHVVDVNVTLRLEPPWPAPAVDVPVAPARSEDVDGVLDIAGRCFTVSRFHLDPLVPRQIADRIKREWVANYVRGQRGERLYTAQVDSSPAGFLAVFSVPSEGGKVRVIDLLGVDPARQGRGVGRALVAHFIREEGPRSLRLEVGTQAANAKSLRLYERMGFLVSKTQYVMHRHVPDGVRSH